MHPSALLLAPALLAAAAPLQARSDLLYTIPVQLLQELGQLTAAAADTAAAPNKLAAVEADASSSSASCTYPARFTISHFTTWAPASSSNTTTFSNTSSSTAPYVAFRYTNADTAIDTACARNASSISLNARAANSSSSVNAGLALRYPCDDETVAFIWQPARTATAPGGSLTLIETACPGLTTTKFEAAGSVRPPAVASSPSSSSSSSLLQCVAKRGAARTSSHATSTDDDSTPYRNELGAAGDGTLCWATGSLAGNFTSLQPSPL